MIRTEHSLHSDDQNSCRKFWNKSAACKFILRVCIDGVRPWRSESVAKAPPLKQAPMAAQNYRQNSYFTGKLVLSIGTRLGGVTSTASWPCHGHTVDAYPKKVELDRLYYIVNGLNTDLCTEHLVYVNKSAMKILVWCIVLLYGYRFRDTVNIIKDCDEADTRQVSLYVNLY